ncbi:MAG: SCO family protein [Rhodospirillaceae bacterium]|nr:SCO family protein [Rhodospirillaceae bacterium]
MRPDTVAPVVVEAPRDFALIDTAGEKVSLANYRGKWLLVFFGFTNCPDVCPTAMLNVSATLRELGDKANDVQPIFITVDPERDTPVILKDYLANFGDHIAGLSGSAEDIAAVAKAYGVFYRKRPMEGDDYTMDHSTALYLVAPDGRYVRAYVPDMDPAQFADALRRLMGASS